MDSDNLFPVRNSFYLGAYQTAIAEATDLDALTEAQKIERDVLVYRSYIEIGSYELVVKEVSKTSPQALQAVKLLAQYVGTPAEKEGILAQTQQWVEDPSTGSDPTTLLIAGIIFATEERYNDALKACHTALSLEMLALCVQVCLKINRSDQAEKYLKAMAAIDEDATLTQLSTAWVNLTLGGSKIQEAFFIYQELGERFNWTVRLYNGSALCSMRMGEWEDAEKRLHEAYEKEPKHPESLANLWCVGLHLGRSVSRHVNLLKSIAPYHASAQAQASADELFERAVSGFVAA